MFEVFEMGGSKRALKPEKGAGCPDWTFSNT